MMTDIDYMALAVKKAREGIAAGQSPFAAIVVRDGQIIATAHNTVWRDTDPTAHAEMNAIRQAATELDSINLSGCTMYTTCEPCPMCLAAIHWAKIDRVVYGAEIADAASGGFSELHVPARELALRGKSHLVVEALPTSVDCRDLFALWQSTGACPPY